MKKERKAYLMSAFPEVPPDIREKMKDGKGANNYAVFLTYGRELFVRCFHRYSSQKAGIVERQRYVFAPDGAVRYGWESKNGWQIRTEFREPVFCSALYGYSFDNSYTVLNFEVCKNSCMKYSMAEYFVGDALMMYFQLYCRHPNVEYLLKQGYSHLISQRFDGYWGTKVSLTVNVGINWKSNDLLKMLGLTRTEFKLLQGRERLYESYIMWRGKYHDLKPEEILSAAELFGFGCGALESVTEKTHIKVRKLIKYLTAQNCSLNDYRDYLSQCGQLGHDITDTAVSMPRDIHRKHEELTTMENAIAAEKEAERKNDSRIAQLYESRRELEFAYGGLILIQPESVREIVKEGAALSHCVGGYAERHAEGALNIMFLRKAAEPDIPYYTMEVSDDLKIVQCRGYKNNVVSRGGRPKPDEINEFEEKYSMHLEKLKVRRQSIVKQKERRSE